MINPIASLAPCHHCQTLTASSDQLCCSGCRFLHNGGWNKPLSFSEDSVYDSPEVQELYNLSEDPNHPLYRLSVQGLQCSSCIHILEDLPLFLETVTHARVNFASGEMHIETTKDHRLGVILQFMEAMGYQARPLKAEDNSSNLQREEDRFLLLRLGVAGACTGNIMLFAVAIYGGLVGRTAFIFNGLSVLLFLPVLFYCAQPFYRGAWKSLRVGYLTVDVPLVIALWLGFIASVFNWLRGSGHVYFDSTAGFFFFILLTRWFLRVSQRKWGQGFFSQNSFLEEFYEIKRADGIHVLPASQIVSGDVVVVKNDQRIPVDGLLLSDSAILDTAWMTGESVPRTLQSSMKIVAGYKVISESIQVKAESTAGQSEVIQSLRRIEAHSLKDSLRVTSFDKAAQWLLLGVFSLSTLIIIFGPQFLGLSWDSAFERALSLLVVACPCALAFGGPLAYGVGLRKASHKGIILKSADVLDRVLECKNIVFDKTGTLTLGQLKLVSQSPTFIPGWMKDLILTLEKKSHHPIAYAFRSAWSESLNSSLQLQDVKEITGKKVFGVYNGKLYSVEGHSSSTGNLSASFKQDEKIIATFEFEDELRSEVKPLLAFFAKKYFLSVLSGDRKDRVHNLSTDLNFNFMSVQGEMAPQDKATWIKHHPYSMMLGDGINDAEALALAHVGVAVQGPMVQGLRLGSVYFMKAGLDPLKDLFEIATQTKKLVRQNLIFALLYNLLAGIAAVLGLVNPLVAAALMPLSSALILINTWRAGK